MEKLMESELLWRLWQALGIAICGTLLFFLGRGYEASKNKGVRKELKRLRKQNEMMKKLTPKLKWGEDVKLKRMKHLFSSRNKKPVQPYEIVTQGKPEDA